jgi:hypothetical protein
MRTVKKSLLISGALMVAIATSAQSCSDQPESQQKESQSRQAGYDQLVANQPGKTMTYSPTRELINFWIETWNEPNKLSFVYFQNANGDVNGYYVLQGLPVSMCASISPTYEVQYNDSAGRVVVPAPANDGVYYSGGQCNTYYGMDATTGTYLEWTAGLGINTMVYEEPQGRFTEAEPLGDAQIEDFEEE